MEARASLSRPGITGLASSQSPVKMDIASVPPVSGPPPTSILPGDLRAEQIFLCPSDPIPVQEFYSLLIIQVVNNLHYLFEK